jgi:hypothetical protein
MQIIMLRGIDMIGTKLVKLIWALTAGFAAILTAGCDADGAMESLILEANPAAQYGSATTGAVPAAEAPTHAEVRHFAIYNVYRAMVDSSGSSGGGIAGSGAGSGIGSASGAPDDSSGNFILWGSRLFGVEHLFCPAGEPKK